MPERKRGKYMTKEIRKEIEGNKKRNTTSYPPAVKLFLVFIESGRGQLLWALAALQAPSVKRCPAVTIQYQSSSYMSVSQSVLGANWGQQISRVTFWCQLSTHVMSSVSLFSSDRSSLRLTFNAQLCTTGTFFLL